MGNIFGRWQGADASAGAVLTGSHCDAIPLAGMYDGTLGVVGGIAALKALKEAVSMLLLKIYTKTRKPCTCLQLLHLAARSRFRHGGMNRIEAVVSSNQTTPTT